MVFTDESMSHEGTYLHRELSPIRSSEKFEVCYEISVWVCSILKIASDWMTF